MHPRNPFFRNSPVSPGTDRMEWEEPEPAEPEADRESLRRALRDLKAAEERVERNAERAYDEARSKLAVQLFPVLDNLDRTLQAAVEHGESEAMIEGVRMVRNQLEAVLAKYGVEKLEAAGERFDPKLHDAVATIPVDDVRLDKVVIDQLAPGYRFGERLLRPAQVVVGVVRA